MCHPFIEHQIAVGMVHKRHCPVPHCRRQHLEPPRRCHHAMRARIGLSSASSCASALAKSLSSCKARSQRLRAAEGAVGASIVHSIHASVNVRFQSMTCAVCRASAAEVGAGRERRSRAKGGDRDGGRVLPQRRHPAGGVAWGKPSVRGVPEWRGYPLRLPHGQMRRLRGRAEEVWACR